jgi:hypothetical protein
MAFPSGQSLDTYVFPLYNNTLPGMKASLIFAVP